METARSRRTAIDAVFDAFAVGDLGASLPLMDSNIVLVVDEGIPDGGTYLGLDGVRSYMSRFLDPWESLTIAAESVEEFGDTLLVRVAQKGTGRGSRVPAATSYVQLWTFRGHKVVRLEVVMDEQRAQTLLGEAKRPG